MGDTVPVAVALGDVVLVAEPVGVALEVPESVPAHEKKELGVTSQKPAT